MAAEFIKPTNGYSFIENEFTDSIANELETAGAFNYYGEWLSGVSMAKNENEFIVVTNNGGFFKVGAQYMVWRPILNREGNRQIVAQAIWSNAALKRTMKSLMKSGETTMDPDYQT